MNQKVKIIKGYVDNNTSQAMHLAATECGFIWFSDGSTEAVYMIPYYGVFETVVSANIKFSRATAGGDVTITSTGSWFSYMAFITRGNEN